MLNLVAVVAIIATTNAYVPEYSEDNVFVYSTADPDAEVSNAAVFNSDAKLKFRVSDTPTEEGIILIPDQEPKASEKAKEGCGKSLGVHVTNIGETFCNVTYFLLTADTHDEEYSNEQDATDVEEQILQFSIYFDNGGKPFLMEIPVFKVPSQLASADQKELQKWANENKVGINSPVDNQKLNDLSEKGEWKGDFKWLSDLLSYGIVESEDPYKITETGTDVVSYTARPIVLPGELTDMLMQVVNKYKKNNE